MPTHLLHGLEHVHRNWGWYLVLGLLLIVVGLIALAHTAIASLVSVIFLGWLLLFTGVTQTVLAFRFRLWSGFFLHLLAGILEFVVGLLIIARPASAAIGLTLVLAIYLIVGGIFRTVTALSLGFPGSGLVALGGVISFLLGMIIWMDWPVSGLWFLGLSVAIDLIAHGAAWVAFALASRRLTTQHGPSGAV